MSEDNGGPTDGDEDVGEEDGAGAESETNANANANTDADAEPSLGPSSGSERADGSDDAADAGQEEEKEELSLTPGVVFGLLANRRDRFLLYLLYERGGTVALSELTTYLAVWEHETTADLLTAEMKRHTRTSLTHASLPKLADYDLITFDRDSGAITLTERGERLEPYLEFAKEQEDEDVESFLERTTRGG
ncbi:hypothetical protein CHINAEXTREME_00890 [Halobiforma lacisalsi AJ5]|uniref:DUF7344 domain-containing protein n=1 Tax=Natronobacterium lacisalsi AJ5 TaxID=358396 RepID=M0LE12_NATLA|nr:hypothetical protein [Halobiforma lacisalsi]APW96404.1 hypothetical protein CHINAEXTREME_00890 [Halobiforma lacisalsi AJ5]EMA31826.1 hypothetical protein C445_13465 [Halobiforma lacisalsi AJ5]